MISIDEAIQHIDDIVEKSGSPLEGNCLYPWGDKNNNDALIKYGLSNKRDNYKKAVSGKSKICEIGFNAGHSLLVMLYENPNAEYTLFDLGEHNYSKPCFEYIKSIFPQTKMQIFWGDSRETMKQYLLEPTHTKFDFIHIDGGHTEDVFRVDWIHSYQLIQDNGVIIFDDTDLPIIKTFVNQLIKNNVVTEALDYKRTVVLEHRILIKQTINIKKKRLLWVGDDYRSKSGYGRVAKELFHYLKNTYEIIHYAIGCRGESDEYYMIDSNDGTAFGFNKLPHVITTIMPDIVILLNDSGIVGGWLSSIKEKSTHKCIIVPYVCTEYNGIPEHEVKMYNESTNGLLAMASFTIDEFKLRGYTRKTMRLSHGYSETIIQADKNVAKQMLGISSDTFVFFSGSKNQPRKRLDIIIRAFVHFLTKYNDRKVILMMNCGLIDMGWNLKELYSRLCKENNIQNMERHIYFCSNNTGDANKNDDELTAYYNASDVGVTTSTGESFGLIPFEQSALGVPQIVPNWGGIIESIIHGSIKVDTNDYYVYPVVLQSANGEARTVYYKDVANAMEVYFTQKDVYDDHSKTVRQNVEGYSWGNISKDMIDFIESLPTELLGGHFVPTERRYNVASHCRRNLK
jgi:hypothetical protein